MKITDVKTYCVSPVSRNYVYVKIETDEGLYGVGEAYSCGPDLATVKTIEYFKDWLIGQDPTRIEYIWTMLYNYSRFPGGCIVDSAISGIDLALWDIAGKGANLPVSSCLAGRRATRSGAIPAAGAGKPTRPVWRRRSAWWKNTAITR
jgi:galactonate dehydratase